MGFRVVFLDIGMADLNGMETAELLRKRGTDECIIFLSGYKEYMEKGAVEEGLKQEI